MKTAVVYSCPFVPAEWIAAHGLTPSRVMPRSAVAGGYGAGPTGSLPATGVCPYAKAFLVCASTRKEAAAIVMTTTCDQMRHLSEFVAACTDVPVFLMHVPSTCGSSTAHSLYRQELLRLGAFLCRVGGSTPDGNRLAAVMAEYDLRRTALRATRSTHTPLQFSRAIARFSETGEVSSGGASVRRTGKRIALLGGPMVEERMVVFDLIEQAGGTVVLDGTETGERTLPSPFSRRRVKEDPLMELADAYFGAIPDAFRRPNDGLYAWLRKEMNSRDVQGILLLYSAWCDTWQAEAQRLKEWARVPVLALDNDGSDSGGNVRTFSRIQAFLEMIP